jgi:RNA polymerase sigma-70 factor, ECF subfamily
MKTELLDTIDKDDAVTTSADNRAGKEDIKHVTAAKNGNRQAFDILVERHQQMIFFVVRRITRTREDAEDVVQRTFQKAFTHMRKFEGRSSFSTWLTRVAINEALMLQRKTRGLREMLIDDSNANQEMASALDIPDSGQSPEVNYSQRERRRILLSAMNELPPGTRRAIQLCDLDERSSEEIARIMGISVGAVKGRVFHGRRKLRAIVKRYVKSARMSGREPSRTIGNTRHHTSDLTGGLTLSLNWTVFDGGARRNNLARAQANVRAAEAQLSATRDQIADQVWAAYSNLNTAFRQHR